MPNRACDDANAEVTSEPPNRTGTSIAQRAAARHVPRIVYGTSTSTAATVLSIWIAVTVAGSSKLRTRPEVIRLSAVLTDMYATTLVTTSAV